MQQEEQADKTEQKSRELEPEAKELKEEMLRKNTPDLIYGN